MNKSLRIFILIILISLLGSAIGPAEPIQAAWSPPRLDSRETDVLTGKASIDPQIYLTLERQGTAQVLVILQQQADLSGASRLQTKAEKGAFVYNQLNMVARQSQGPLGLFLDSKGVEYRAYWIQNMLLVSVDATLLDELRRQPGVERIDW